MQLIKLKNKLKFVFFIFLVLNFISCAEIKTRRQIKKDSKVKTVEQKTKDEEGLSQNKEGAFPKETHVDKPKVGLILGPGGIKTFAQTGVIRELEKARIPIDMVLGIEWGSLVGALYAQKAQVHEAEWILYKSEKKDFYKKSFFEDKFESKPVKDYLASFNPEFLKSPIDGYSIPFSCPSRSIWSGRVVWQKRGNTEGALARCLAYPPFFKPEVPWMAAGFSLESAKQYLISQGINVVIFVNVLSYGDLFDKEWASKNTKTALIWRELQSYIQENKKIVDEVIEVETRKFNIFDFDNRKYLVRAGEKAGRKAGLQISQKYGF